MKKGALATRLACEQVGVGGGGLWGVARCRLAAALTPQGCQLHGLTDR